MYGAFAAASTDAFDTFPCSKSLAFRVASVSLELPICCDAGTQAGSWTDVRFGTGVADGGEARHFAMCSGVTSFLILDRSPRTCNVLNEEEEEERWKEGRKKKEKRKEESRSKKKRWTVLVTQPTAACMRCKRCAWNPTHGVPHRQLLVRPPSLPFHLHLAWLSRPVH